MGKVSPVQGHKAGLCWGATQAERFRAGSHAGRVGRLPKCVLWAWRLLPPETRCPSVCPHPYFLLPPSTLAGASLPWNGEVGKGKLVECGLVAQSKTCREGGGGGWAWWGSVPTFPKALGTKADEIGVFSAATPRTPWV